MSCNYSQLFLDNNADWQGLLLFLLHVIFSLYASLLCRKIVAKFLQYKDKEFVRKQWKILKGTPFHVSEQFPKGVVEQRKRAWITYDTLYVDGKAVKV